MTCAGVCTVAVVVAVVYLVQTLQQLQLTAQQLRQTAEQAQRTAEAVEELTRRLDENVVAVGGVTERIREFADGLSSGWVRAAQFAAGFLGGLKDRWEDRRRAPEPEEETEEAES